MNTHISLEISAPPLAHNLFPSIHPSQGKKLSVFCKEAKTAVFRGTLRLLKKNTKQPRMLGRWSPLDVQEQVSIKWKQVF